MKSLRYHCCLPPPLRRRSMRFLPAVSPAADAMDGNFFVQSRPLRVNSFTFPAIEPGLDAIAVEFDLVHPIGTVRCLVAECSKRRRNERRKTFLLARHEGSSFDSRLSFCAYGRMQRLRVAPNGVFWYVVSFVFFVLLLCHSFLGPLAISSIVRPVTTERGLSSRMSLSRAERSAPSCCLISNQLSRFSPGRRCMRTRCQPPCSFSPCELECEWPLARPLCGSFSGSQ